MMVKHVSIYIDTFSFSNRQKNKNKMDDENKLRTNKPITNKPITAQWTNNSVVQQAVEVDCYQETDPTPSIKYTNVHHPSDED